jgi:hypothetical protein
MSAILPIVIEAARRQHEEVVIRAGPWFHRGLVLVSVQHHVHAIRQEPSRPFAIGEIGEPMMHQRQAEARQVVAAVAGEKLDLVVRQSKRAGIRVITGEPGGVESDHPQRRVEPIELDLDSIPEALVRVQRWPQLRPTKVDGHRLPDRCLSLEDRIAPPVVKPDGWHVRWRNSTAIA